MTAKPRSDAKLKSLPQDRQDQVIEWCREGYEHARKQLAADGLRVSIRALSEFFSWYRLKQRFEGADSRSQQIEELLRDKNPSMAPAKVREIGQTLFTLEAMESQDAQTFIGLERLKLDQDSAKFKAELEREKISISRKRLQLVTCEKFLLWFADARAREIAEGGGTRAQKIEALGAAMFDDWSDEEDAR